MSILTPIAPAAFVPDAEQARVLAHRGRLLRVLGAPGTGKTRLAVEIVAEQVRTGQVSPQACLILCATRRSAARVRDQVTRRIGTTTREPLARTFASLAFGILHRAAIRDGEPTPSLLSGAEQDAILQQLLAGHRADPGSGPDWPPSLADALSTAGFRTELRDLLMRAVENGLDAPALAGLGREHGRPEWVAAAAVLGEYDEVTALSRPGAYDPSWLVTGACDLLAEDEELRAGVIAGIELIVVDDAQEVTAGGARLLSLLAAAGVAVVLLGDPDSAVQGFRGADPDFLATGWSLLGDGPSVVLRRGHRLPEELAPAGDRAAELIGALGGGRQRCPRPAVAADDSPGGAMTVQVFRSAAQEAAYLADVLRRAHLLDGVPWRAMAVVVRGAARAQVVRRVLLARHVPVADAESGVPIDTEESVRPLLTLARAAIERVRHRAGCPPRILASDPDGGWRLTGAACVDLLTSPYGEADAVTLRRLRRAVRRMALEAGEAAPADDLLARALTQPAVLDDMADAAGARRIARMLAAATDVVARPGSTSEDVLWAMWTASELADEWRDSALAGGRAGARADAALDAVIALLAAAGDFTDRLPGIGVAAFLDQLALSDVAADSIVTRGVDRDRVEVLTPHAAAGREWALVCVAGVQEGSWPDLRLRGSLLGSEVLVDVLRGRDPSLRAAQRAIRHDEARLFHVAVTRAGRILHISAVRADDEAPSPYLDVLAPWTGPGERPFTEVEQPMTLVGAVAGLRRDLNGDEGVRERAAVVLARLGEAGVRGARPREWWGLRPVSDDRPRVAPGRPVPVSPSALVGFGECQARWLLTRSGGEGPAIGSAALGTLVHEVLAECGDADAATLGAALDARWSRLGLGRGWTARGKRADAAAMLTRATRYFDHASRHGWRREAAEVEMRLVLGRAQLTGVVDRLESDAAGRLRVIDFKTGSSKPKRGEVQRHPQLGAYQAAVAAGAFGAGRTGAGAALVHLGKAGGAGIEGSVQEQAPLADDGDPGWAGELIQQSAEQMASATVTATEGTWCRTCPVQSSCPVRAEGAMLA